MKLPWLDPSAPNFPNTSQALDEPNGLLAAGGQLSADWLLNAYQKGIFPWFNEGDPILWWTPSPRMVIYPHQFHLSRSLRKTLKKADFTVTLNTSFTDVITACAAPRELSSEDLSIEPSLGSSQEPETWITPIMADAYIDLHSRGIAHSVEVWQDKNLVGGLYGLALGEVFFGESMFSQMTNGSKIAMAHLVEYLKAWQYKLIDCQVYNDHLNSLGAIEIDRHTFEQIIHQHTADKAANPKDWYSRDISLPSSHWVKR